MISSRDPIIIVDDDTDDHFIFREIAQKLKLTNEIKYFRSAPEVLQYLRATTDHPFIIFCDINMPQMDGLAFRREINMDEYLKRKSIPFIFFTTAASDQQIREAYDLTVQGFFIKESSFIATEKTFELILRYWEHCKHPNAVS
jgi:CheY-like chemotaxis protein